MHVADMKLANWLRPAPGRNLSRTLIVVILLAGGCGSNPVRRNPPAPPSANHSSSACSTEQRQPDQGRQHINDLTHAYTVHPATSGPHFPVPLPPQPAVSSVAIPEPRAVHNLEHGYVVVYFQPSGDDALPAKLVDSVGGAVTAAGRTLMAPYTQLPAGVALALTAWDFLQICPKQVSADDAGTVLATFIAAHRDSPTAPEPGAP